MDLNNILSQAQEMNNQIQNKLARTRVDATAGGEMVTAVVNGKQELIDLKIDKALINPDDPDLLRDVIKAAVNSAINKSRSLAGEEMKKVLGGLPIPPGIFG